MSEIIQGDALTILNDRFGDDSVQCCITSPPYWGLRDYKTGTWEGGAEDCNHTPRPQVSGSKTDSNSGALRDKPSNECKCGAIRIDQQLGLETTPEDYVAKMVEVFREVRRVLKPDGTLWLNLGDSYNGYMANQRATSISATNQESRPEFESGCGRRTADLKAKDLIGVPWRVAFALQADGWYLRCDIIWSKPNPMPESVTDRPTKAHEYLFLLSKSARYYYDAEAIQEQGVCEKLPGPNMTDTRETYGPQNGGNSGLLDLRRRLIADKQSGHGRRHAGFNERWDETEAAGRVNMRNKRSVWTIATQPYPEAHFATFPEKLVEPCVLAGCPAGGLVLDPFAGSGTVLAVAQHLGREAVGIELNADYIALANVRMAQQGMMLEAL